MSTVTISHATRDDIPHILRMIKDLASYEEALDRVKATEKSLGETLTFALPSSTTPASPPADPIKPDPSEAFESSSTPGYAKCLILREIPSPAAEPQVLGMALYYTTYSTWTSRPGIHLEDLWVDPSARRKGYGKLLLRRLAEESLQLAGKAVGGGAADQGEVGGAESGARLEWECLRWNESALGFYDGVGAERREDWVSLRVEGGGLRGLAGEK